MDRATANDIAAGGPGTIELGGRTWLVGQTPDEALGALRNWVRRRLKSPLAALAGELKHLPPELHAEAVRAAVALSASGSDLTADAINDALTTADGLAFWLAMVTREYQPEVTPETFRPHLEDEWQRYVVLAELRRATSLDRLDPNGRSASGHSPTSTVPPSTAS